MTYQPPAPPYLGPPSKSSGGNNKPIKRIVLHGTVSAPERGGARKIASYFRSAAAGGSAHYIIDPGEVVQSAYDSVICWHAPPNDHSLGIEMCDMPGPVPGDKPGSARYKALKAAWRWNKDNQKAMLQRTAELTAELCLAYDVPVRMVGPAGLKAGRKGICEHSDVSEAFKQSSHWDLGNFPRRRFIRMVRAEVAAIKDAGKPIAPEPDLSPNAITKARDLLEQAYRNSRKKSRKRRIERALKELPRR